MKKNSLKFLSIIAFLTVSLPALAAQNMISSVIISNSKDKPNAYELNIDSTSSVQYKTHIEEDGSVYFDLKNSTLAQNAGTVYDDVTNIDNVTVRQLDKKNVRIYVKGKNAQNTDLVFLNSVYEQTPNNKKVIINRPQSEYQPTNHEDLESQGDIQDWDDNSFNFSHLLNSVLLGLKEGPAGIVLILLLGFALCAIIIKTIASKLSSDKEPLIGLNQNFNQDYVQQTSLRRDEAIKNAQAELAVAHKKYQDYLSNKYKSNAKPAQNYNTDAIKKSIALNQYQKSNKNPYLDQEVIRIKKDLNQTNNRLSAQRQIPKENFSIPPRPKMEQTQKSMNMTSPYIHRPNNRLEAIASQKHTIKTENFRFLESVTKIYENSGRKDLAQELKNSMMKVKQSI